MQDLLNDLVQCPKCGDALRPTGAPEAESCSCPGCGTSYPVAGGVIDLIFDLQLQPSRAQALMESPTMAKIYSGKLWRRSWWQGWLLGIQFDAEAAMIMEAARAEPTSTVLDLACASGIYTRLFAAAAKQGRVVGLDLSMPMLLHAVSMDRQAQVDNVAYLRGSAMDLPFADARFDCVNCCGALHLFPDAAPALREIVRVLKPGGRFTVATFRKRESARGRADHKTGDAIGVNFFTAEGLSQTLAGLGFSTVHVRHDAARWMILSGEKG